MTRRNKRGHRAVYLPYGVAVTPEEIIMLKALSTAGLAFAILAGGALVPQRPAFAQDIELRIGPDGVRPIIRDRERNRDRRRGRCDPREARAGARDIGLRDPEVIRETRDRVVVEGITRRGIRTVTFANRRGCPEF